MPMNHAYAPMLSNMCVCATCGRFAIDHDDIALMTYTPTITKDPMTTYDTSLALTRMFKLIEDDADTRANNAAHGGEHGDRGATRLRDEVKFYKAGMSGTIPPSWEKYHKQAHVTLDPEWREYERLRRKFEGA